MYIDKLDNIVYNIVNKYNNTYHSTIKMKPVDVKSHTYIENDQDIKFEVGNHVRISKYKNVFAKGYTPNLLFKKLKYCSVDICYQ